MYSTCLFCHASLGTNEGIEAFPIGRRLAFDSQKGRLWVVCRKCARWNLTPVEERWEAVEACERAFSGTRMRVSTDNVGLARLSDGLELVRIGKPQRPEFAAWRYGDQFGRRRRKFMVYGGIVGAAAIGNATGSFLGPMLGIGAASGVLSLVAGVVTGANMYAHHRVKGRVFVPGEKRLALIRPSQLEKVRILSDGESWRLRMPLDAGEISNPEMKKEVTIEGEAALRAAATIFAISNRAGASREFLDKATDILIDEPDPSRLMLQATARSWKIVPELNRWVLQEGKPDRPGETSLTNIQAEMLLALEMATNEDIERRALEGELAMLEEAWRQAEEIAAIVDNLDLGKPDDSSTRS